jgi:signal peptidase I
MENFEELLLPEYKPRKPWIAFLFSIFTPGLGQIYNGQVKKGIFLSIFWLSILLLLVFTSIPKYFYGLIISFGLYSLLYLYIIGDAIFVALKRMRYVSPKYDRWYFYSGIAISIMAISYFIDFPTNIGVQTFKLSSAGNAPTIEEGDWIVVDMEAYKDSTPRYGDLVTYIPKEGGFWMFRVVGLPNDQIKVRNNVVIVNGDKCETIHVKDTTLLQDTFKLPTSELIEVLPNGHKHHFYKQKYPYISEKANSKTITIPPDCYFVMGDNRDNAFDSRYHGSVKRKDIVGKVLYSYWGKSMDRINIDFSDK